MTDLRSRPLLLSLVVLTLIGCGSRHPDSPPPPESPETGFVFSLSPPDPVALAQAAAAPATIVDYGPRGTVESEPVIRVRFSGAMVPIGDPNGTGTPPNITIAPDIEGSWEWQGPDLLLFRADYGFAIGQTYSVSVPTGTIGNLGRQLETPIAFEFETRPRLEGFTTWYDVYDRSKLPISQNQARIELNAPVDLAAFKDSVSLELLPWKAPPIPTKITAVSWEEAEAAQLEEEEQEEVEPYGDPQPVSFELSEGEACPAAFCVIVTATKPLVPGSKMKVTVASGFVSTEGPLPSLTGGADTWTLPEPFRLTSAICNDKPCRPDSEIDLVFNKALDSKSKPATLVTGAPKDTHIYAGWTGISVWGGFEPNKRLTLKLRKGIRSESGETIDPLSLSVDIGPVRPSLSGSWGYNVIDRRSPHSLILTTNPNDKPRYRQDSLPYEQWIPTLEKLQSRQDVKSLEDTLPVVSIKKRKFDSLAEWKQPLGEVVPEGTSGAVVYHMRNQTETLAGVTIFTRLGITLLGDSDETVIMVTDLATSDPMAAVDVEIRDAGNNTLWTGKTGHNGVVHAEFANIYSQSRYVLVRTSEDAALLALPWTYGDPDDTLQGVLVSDRVIYKPGEKVLVTGFARAHVDSVLRSGRELTDNVVVSIKDPQKNIDVERKVPLDDHGNFHASLDLPPLAGLGWAYVNVSADGTDVFNTRIRIAEFRTPEFEVNLTPVGLDAGAAADGAIIRGEDMVVTIEGKFLNGSPMAKATTDIRTHSDSVWHNIPDWPRVTFGNTSNHAYRNQYDAEVTDKGTLDSGGALRWTTSTHAGPTFPMRWTVEAEVQDTSRQTVAATTTVLVHPGEFYLGLRVVDAPTWNHMLGQSVEVEVIAAHPDGRAFDEISHIKDLAIFALGPETVIEPATETEPAKTERSRIDCKVPALKTGGHIASCKVPVDEIGAWQLEATAADTYGNALDVSVVVGVVEDSPLRSVSQNTTQRAPEGWVADKTSYAPGDTANITYHPNNYMVATRGLFAFGGSEIETWSVLESAATTMQTPLAIEIQDEHVPAAYIQSIVVSERSTFDLTDGHDSGRPQARSDGVHLSIPIDHHRLEVTVTPEAPKASPGDQVPVEVLVLDAKGDPVDGANVTLWAVDEGVLLIEPLKIPDLTDRLHPSHTDRMTSADLRSLMAYQLDFSPPNTRFGFGHGGLGSRGSGRGGGGAGMKAGGPMVAERGNFETTPYFDATLVTGSDGKVIGTVSLPDNLTRFRLFAIANDGVHSFGKAESAIEVGMPIMLRPTMPRFAAIGDVMQAGTIVQNATAEELNATVSLVVEGPIEHSGKAKQTVAVPAGLSREVIFDLEALDVGTATLRFALEAGPYGDAVRVELPIRERITTETTAAYGVLDGNAVAIPLVWPDDIRPDIGGLDISMASTRLTGLRDAAQYLVRYPHGCLEQTSSRLMPLGLLRQIGPELTGVPADGLGDMMQAGVDRLASMQLPSGGFGYWPGNTTAHLYASMFAMLALHNAQTAGQETAGPVLERASAWLVGNLDPATADDQPDALIQLAFAGYVLAELGYGTMPADVLQSIVARSMELPLYARLWLVRGMVEAGADDAEVDEILQTVLNAASATARSLHIREPARPMLWRWMSSDQRTDAIALDVLLTVRPDHPSIEKLANGLLDARQGGRWRNTQENAWALRAMLRYLEVVESEVPNYKAGVWLDDDLLTAARFEGRSGDTSTAHVPIAQVIESDGPVVFGKEGQGRLYYRLGATIARENQDLEAASHGFTLERTLETVDGELIEPGTPLEAGTVVNVRLTFSSSETRYYVALNDPLPAGLEAIDPQDKTSSGRARVFRGPFHHNEFRDDRVTFYADQVYPGSHAVTYRARATTRGTFSAPPATIEEMYAPEVAGRTASAEVVVESQSN